MAKKAANSDRNDPKQNKSLAVRLMIDKMPNGKLAEVSKAVKEEYGHEIPASLFYAVKAKSHMKSSSRSKGQTVKQAAPSLNSAASWVNAIKLARQLLQATGNVENAVALLKAVEA